MSRPWNTCYSRTGWCPTSTFVFNIARGYEQLGLFDEAFRHYSEYLRLRNRTRPPGQRLSAPSSGSGTGSPWFGVKTDPPGAALYIDRRNLGTRGRTPVALALPPGTHTVFVDLEGHDSGEQAVELSVGEEVTVDLDLARILGSLQVNGSPEGAEIRVGDDDGAVLGVLPGVLSLPPGPHVLVVSAPGYQTTRQIAAVEARAESQTVVDLGPWSPGTLVVDAHERDALVEIDGRAEGLHPRRARRGGRHP